MFACSIGYFEAASQSVIPPDGTGLSVFSFVPYFGEGEEKFFRGLGRVSAALLFDGICTRISVVVDPFPVCGSRDKMASSMSRLWRRLRRVRVGVAQPRVALLHTIRRAFMV